MTSKVCTKCSDRKKISDFAWRKMNIKRHDVCRECAADAAKAHYLQKKDQYTTTEWYARSAERRLKTKLWLLGYLKQHPCKCGEARIECLEFHHIDPTTKEFNVGMGTCSSRNLEKVKAECGKCIVLCANCHRIETAKQQGWYEQLYTGGLMDRTIPS